MKVSTLAAMAIATMASPATARNLIVLDFQPDQTIMMVDADDVTTVGSYVRGWQYFGSTLDHTRFIGTDLEEYDCGQKRNRLLQRKFFGLDGLSQGDGRSDGAWHFPVPGTNNYAAMQVACHSADANLRDSIGDDDPIEVVRRFFKSDSTKK